MELSAKNALISSIKKVEYASKWAHTAEHTMKRMEIAQVVLQAIN